MSRVRCVVTTKTRIRLEGDVAESGPGKARPLQRSTLLKVPMTKNSRILISAFRKVPEKIPDISIHLPELYYCRGCDRIKPFSFRPGVPHLRAPRATDRPSSEIDERIIRKTYHRSKMPLRDASRSSKLSTIAGHLENR